MGGKPRDRIAEEAAITAAAGRLLAGTPLRSTTGKLTVSGLITESGLRRDVVYEHAALVDTFKGQAKAQRSTPLAMQQLAAQHAAATRQLAGLKSELAAERATGSVLRKTVAELSLELQHACDQLTAARNVVPLRLAGAATVSAR